MTVTYRIEGRQPIAERVHIIQQLPVGLPRAALRDMSEEKTKKQQKTGKPTISPDHHDQNVGQHGGVANPGQPLTGNKNQGDDLDEVIPRDIGADRPTRDDGDNDDEGELK